MIKLKTIRMTLDEDSIDQAIAQIEDFEKRLKPAMQCLIDYLAERGVEVARASLLLIGGNDKPLDYGKNPIENEAYDTGALYESIRYETGEGKATVIAGEGLHNAMGNPDSESYAYYVEYGNGMSKPDGWWYPAPWGWRAYNGMMYAWTPGMAPRPFMGNTYHDLMEEARMHGAQIIAEYIRGERA